MTTDRLLLVDDNPDNLEVLTVILGQKYRVHGYACAQEALTALETAKPNLLLLDIGMTPVDGVQCLKAIRAIPGYGSIPAIALTAYARDVERKAFFAAGFQAVVTKPIFDPGDLFAAIAPLLTTESSGTHRGVPAPASLTAPTDDSMIASYEFDHPPTSRPA
jgi:CheY-like chemotaxis protein